MKQLLTRLYMQIRRYTPEILALEAGVALGIGSCFSTLWFVSLASFGIFVYALNREELRSNKKRLLIAGGSFGAAAYGLGFHPIFWDALPLNWLGAGPTLGLVLISIIWSINTLAYATLFAFGTRLLQKLRGISWLDLFIIPSWYVICDWLGMWVFSLIHYGNGTYLSANFSAGSPLYQLVASGLTQPLAWLGGPYLVGFVQALLGVLVYFAVTKQGRERLVAVFLLFGIPLSLCIASNILTTEPRTVSLRVALLTEYGALSEENKAEAGAAYQNDLHFLSSLRDANVVVFPEDSRFLAWVHEQGYDAKLRAALPNSTVIDSAPSSDGTHWYQQIEAYDTKTDTSAVGYKQFLMPFGEELPYLYRVVGELIGQHTLIAHLLDVRSYSIPADVPQTLNIQGLTAAAMACSEGMSPNFYAGAARDGATVFFNISSHSWYHESRAMHTIALWQGQMRAMESGRYYVRSGNSSPSFVVSPSGTAIAQSAWDSEKPLMVDVYPYTNTTPYVLLRFIWPYLLILPLFSNRIAKYLRNK